MGLLYFCFGFRTPLWELFFYVCIAGFLKKRKKISFGSSTASVFEHVAGVLVMIGFKKKNVTSPKALHFYQIVMNQISYIMQKLGKYLTLREYKQDLKEMLPSYLCSNIMLK